MFPITNDAVVLGLLAVTLAGIFYASSLPKFKKFFTFVPSLLLCYFIPAAFNSFGIVDGEASSLYFVASRYLLPASLVLLCLSIDLKGIYNLGPKALIMFFAATVGIVIGGPIALWIVGQINPEVFGGDSPEAMWRGLSTVAGSWIGGGANQAALKEISETMDKQFSIMLIVDVFVANLWMPFLLYGASRTKAIDKWLKADSSAVDALKERVEKYSESIARIPTFTDLMVVVGIAFGAVAISHIVADTASVGIHDWFSGILSTNPNSFVQYLSSLEKGFFWIVVMSTIIGVALSFTKAKNYEGAGASKVGSLFLYILVATIGMKMDVAALIANWGTYSSAIIIGLIWMLVHIIVLITVARLIKAPFFFVAVGSQANVGGAASAPIVASAFSPALAPVGILLAVLGYAVGTVAAIICMEWMHVIS
ncbi:MAG: hypothetical protein COA49_01905 [Bacteroidetes bacterium]|nr:MAG: hypothetical protein COA49_01905 [Bacteroidota bacterium]